MKKMIQKLFAITTALMMVLSMTAMVCNAYCEEDTGISTCALDWEEEDDDSFRK